MLKRVVRLLAFCAPASLAFFLLSVVPRFGVLHGASPQPQVAGKAAASKTTLITRAPLRHIEDPNPSFSSVSVDVAHNEIVLEDENLDRIVAYGRLDNTPKKAAFTEPKRIIGGSNTKISENCGLYVDPFSGDIYSVNGDTANYLTVWSHEKKGNETSDRTINTPHRGFAIAVDEGAKELFLTIESPPAVVVYPKNADANQVPLRIVEGDKTQLAEVHGIALDTKNQVMFVVNQGPTSSNTSDGGWARDLKPGSPTVEWTPDSERWKYLVPGSGKVMPPSITVYPLKANGDAAPVRIIQGPLTQLDWPVHIFSTSTVRSCTSPILSGTTFSFSAQPTTGTWRPFESSRGRTRGSASHTASSWILITTSCSWPILATTPLPCISATPPATCRRFEPSALRRPMRPRPCSATSGRSPTTPSAINSWCRIEWPTRRLRLSPGWRMAT